MKGLAVRNGGRVGLAALVAILLLGLGLRVGEAWDGRSPVYDAQAYADIAIELERGNGFALGPGATQPASNYSPGLPLFVGGIYAVTGGVHERTARLALALIGTLAVLFAYLIGRRLSGPVAGLIAAATVAIYPALLEYQGMLMSEPLAATLLSGAVLAMLWAAGMDGPRPAGGWLFPGLLLGALALVRPEYLAISFPVAVVIFARRGRDDWRAGLAQALIMLVGLAIVVVPWTVRNEVALGRFVPISTGGGQVLFAGSYMPSGGNPEDVGAEVLKRHPELRSELPTEPRLEQILAALAHQRFPGLEADAALSRMGRERLWDDVSEQPVAYLGFLSGKLWLIWGHGPREIMHAPAWALFHWLLLAFGLLGLVSLALQRRWEALLLGTALLAATAIGLLLVASPRRALVAVPLLAALAGVGAAWVAGQLQQRIRH
jgi:4-amino-4-deoxy-L-arabinose transferase-like glycosyltransferase